MKKFSFLSLLILLFSLVYLPEMTEASTKKTAVYFSELNDEYSQITRPAGQYKFHDKLNYIDAKSQYSSIWDKQLKVYHSLKQEGFNVSIINEKDLTNQKTLQQYDTIVFAYGVLMTHEQRQVLKQYVRDGGGFVSIYTGAVHEMKQIQNYEKQIHCT